MMRNLGLAIAAAAAIIATTAVPGAAYAAGTDVDCTEETITIDIASGAETIAGTYCRPDTGGTAAEITIAIPGGTYDRWYWDPDYDPGRYSFARTAAEAGHPVFAIDRLGTGSSSRPPSIQVTTTLQAEAVSAVADQLHDTGFGDGGIDRVVLAGHSMGTAAALLAAADGADIDGIIATGLTPNVRLRGLADLATHLRPAAADPALADDYGSDPGYVTTTPDSRPGLFYADNAADPDLIDRDEARKSVISLTELPDALVRIAVAGAVGKVTVPVLNLMGGNDVLFCAESATHCGSTADLVAQQAPQFSAAACYSAAVIDGAGHDIALHRSAPDSHKLMTDWLDAVNTGACPSGDAAAALMP